MGSIISFCDPEVPPPLSEDDGKFFCFALFCGFKQRDDFLSTEDVFRHNLIRKRNINALEIYRVVDVLGKGSIGSVSVVKKRAEKVGGSARTSKFKNQLILPDSYHGKYLSDSYHHNNKYFAPSTESFGLSERTNKTDVSESSNTEKSIDSNSFRSNQNFTVMRVKKRTSFDQHMYALKTVNADLVGDKEIFNEMLNEIEILRNLDHPNIVRALEVYQGRSRKGDEICISKFSRCLILILIYLM